MTVQQRLQDPAVRRVFEEELLFGEATDTLEGLLESLGITQRELADRLGVTEGRVSQVLSGKTNLTLRSLAGFGWALGVRFMLRPVPTNRAGTPAQHDPPFPRWIAQLARRPDVRFGSLSLPPPGRVVFKHPVLRVIPGGRKAA